MGGRRGGARVQEWACAARCRATVAGVTDEMEWQKESRGGAALMRTGRWGIQGWMERLNGSGRMVVGGSRKTDSLSLPVFCLLIVLLSIFLVFVCVGACVWRKGGSEYMFVPHCLTNKPFFHVFICGYKWKRLKKVKVCV